MKTIKAFLQDLRDCLVAARTSFVDKWKERRWLRAGGCPDHLPF